MYKLVIEKYALKKIAKINPSHFPAIKKAIDTLALNPRQPGYKKLRSNNAYRIRSGNYRIIYEIHDDIITIVVIDVGHRKEIYRRL
ncbi:MAG: type II toxin-antitoxin system RelE/ParE family toxin [Ferruginibacter sp.]